jgi:two-component system, OmpR family, sensor kinase
MTLRRRLTAGLIAVALTLTIGAVVIAVVQRNYAIRQLDSQIESARPVAQKVVNQSIQKDPTGLSTVVKGETFIGRLTAGGELEAIVTPISDPTMTPDVSDPHELRTPRTRRTTAGSAARVRVSATPLKDGSEMIIALSESNIDAAFRRLMITVVAVSAATLLMMGLVVAWVVRLGIRPIRMVTDTADAIANGATDLRVEVVGEGTEAARLATAFNRMIDVTQAAEERLRRFVADASHELRTPLTTLRGYATFLEIGGFPTEEDRSDAIRRMGEESRRMGRIVEDLLLLAQLDEQTPESRIPVDLVSLLHDVAADARVVGPSREISVETGEGATVIGDRDHLLQAVTALVINALRYSEPDSPIDLRLRCEAGRARIEVVDRGSGIAEAELPHVFERFYRTDRARSRAQGGSGLGLSIVDAIVRAHGGTCGVESELGVGSTFWIDLPAVVD